MTGKAVCDRPMLPYTDLVAWKHIQAYYTSRGTRISHTVLRHDPTWSLMWLKQPTRPKGFILETAVDIDMLDSRSLQHSNTV